MDVLGHSLKGRAVGLVGMGAIARAAADLFHVRLSSRGSLSPFSLFVY